MGLISKKAKEYFFARKLENFDWLKKEKASDIDATVFSLKPKPNFRELKPWIHQKVCFLLAVYLQRLMIFLDMGAGKSLVTLMILQYRKDNGEKPKAIVFVPYVITVDTWIEETAKWTDLKCVPLIGTGIENLNALKNEEGDLFVICYQSAVSMLAKRVPSKKKGKKIDWVLHAKDVNKHFKTFDMLVMDEVHKCGNITSKTYIMCRAISKKVNWVFGLTGTPFGRNVEMLWSQIFLIDLGKSLGDTLGLFRSMFFKETINYWGGREYKFIKKLLPNLKRFIKSCSIRYTIKECVDMPKKSYIKKYVRANDEIKAYYNKIVESLETLSFNKIKFRQIESEHWKLKQLSSGFMTFKGDDSSKIEYAVPDNPKLEALKEIIESIPEDSKIIIFHDFVYSNKLISDLLTKMKISHARVWGKQKDKLGELRRFKRDKKCRAIVLNTQSGSSSQNLQMANYIIFFEQPRSAIDREQAERRSWRPGQLLHVFIIDILMRNTIDEKQFRMNRQGKNLLQAVLDQTLKIERLK